MTSVALQDHTLARELALPPRARDLLRELRTVLVNASNSRRLRTAPQRILQLVKLLSEPPPSVAEKLRDLKLGDHAYCIVGGDKNQERDRDRGHFLRFDLNLPEHRNEYRELRCHLHPGSDDIIVPAPKLSPIEMLTLLTDGLRRAGNRATSRAPTAFEVDWFGRTHKALSGP